MVAYLLSVEGTRSPDEMRQRIIELSTKDILSDIRELLSFYVYSLKVLTFSASQQLVRSTDWQSFHLPHCCKDAAEKWLEHSLYIIKCHTCAFGESIQE